MIRLRTGVIAVLFFMFIAATFCLRLNAKDEKNEIEIPLIDTPPRIDGKLDEPVWSTAVRFQKFVSFVPDYGKPASEQTVIYACSDGENFYFAARCFQRNASDIKGTVTRRDKMFADDWILVAIDTFHDYQSAYGFMVNPLGIQGDGMINADGYLDWSHDMVWFSRGAIDDQGYTVEIKIPFKSIRFPLKKKVKMGLWLVRNIIRTSENVSFPEIFPDKGAYLSQSQPILVSDMKYRRVIEALPALTHSRVRGREQGQWAAEKHQTDFSLTGKLGITPSLVLDAAYNPDFSQVEADAGQLDVNLRHSLYYPEKRPFFLEGMEEFKFSGNTEEAPLYAIVHTRNIIDPLFGLKLSGKINKKNSMAAIFALDEPLDDEGPAETTNAVFGILRFRHTLKQDAYIGGFYTGRDFSGGYNRVAGIDGRLRFSRSAVVEYHLLGSLTRAPEGGEQMSGHALGLRYHHVDRHVFLDFGLQDISRDFQLDAGYLTRQGITRLAALAMYRFYPKSGFFQRIDPYYWSYHILDKESNLVETFNLFTFRIGMPRNSMFRLDMILANEVYQGKRFNTSGIGFETYSQITGKLYVYLFFRRSACIYYNPNNPFPGRANQGKMSLTYQPTENFNTSLDLLYDDFYRKPDSQKVYKYIILRNRTIFQVNKYLFFRGIGEYNSYRKKMLLNALASFTYIPGTVVHIGYGSVLEKIQWNREWASYVPAERFMETNRAFFFKISYLWRF
jgi:hypothetical protein